MMVSKCRSFAVVVLLIGLLGLIGCETTRGMTKGTAEGIVQDGENFWQALTKIDNWFRKNLW